MRPLEDLWRSEQYENLDFATQQFYGAYDIKWFLEKLYHDEDCFGDLMFSASNEAGEQGYGSDLTILIALDCAKLAKITNIFYCISLSCNESLWDSHCGLKDKKAVPCLWVNIKIQNKYTTTNKLPSLSDAVNFLNSQSMKPAIIVNTFDELQSYWILETPFIIDSNAALEKFMKLSHDFQQKIIAAGLKHGWQIEDTSNVDRYQRLPGTWNWKFNPPEPITILETRYNDYIFLGEYRRFY